MVCETLLSDEDQDEAFYLTGIREFNEIRNDKNNVN